MSPSVRRAAQIASRRRLRPPEKTSKMRRHLAGRPMVGLGRAGVLSGVLLTLCWARASDARDAEAARAEAQQGVISVRADLARLNTNPSAGEKAQHPPEQLIAAGDLSLRTKDYDQAIDTFSQVVELFRQGKSDRNAHADGL